jgi:hypothetical protein
MKRSAILVGNYLKVISTTWFSRKSLRMLIVEKRVTVWSQNSAKFIPSVWSQNLEQFTRSVYSQNLEKFTRSISPQNSTGIAGSMVEDKKSPLIPFFQRGKM